MFGRKNLVMVVMSPALAMSQPSLVPAPANEFAGYP